MFRNWANQMSVPSRCFLGEAGFIALRNVATGSVASPRGDEAPASSLSAAALARSAAADGLAFWKPRCRKLLGSGSMRPVRARL